MNKYEERYASCDCPTCKDTGAIFNVPNRKTYRITHHPRNSHGTPLPMAPIEFTCTENCIQPLKADPHKRPYKAFDGSTWYAIFESEMEYIEDEP